VKVRSENELELYIEEHPCAACGTRTSVLQLAYSGAADGALAHHVYSGTCAKCGAALRYELDGPYPWPELPLFTYGAADPSEAFTSAELLSIAERYAAEAPEDPAGLETDVYFKHVRQLGRAIGLHEDVAKVPGETVDEALVASLRARRERYLAISPEMNARHKATTKQVSMGTITGEKLKAHEAWIARGQKGDGRLVVENASAGGLKLGNVKLSGARLTRISFDGATVDFARFLGTELVECTAVGTNFAHTNFDGATLDRCTFDRARMTLSDFKDGKVTGGSFRGATADRGAWNRIVIKGANLQELEFGDCVLDGAILEDCDLRQANFGRVTPSLDLCSMLNTTLRRCDLRGSIFDGRRLDGTRFIDCKFAGITGNPAIEGNYVVERPDFSARGDGSDIRSAAEVYAIWGKPH
jgi:uncharacterized protein YjbI with pentapeptide repeats